MCEYEGNVGIIAASYKIDCGSHFIAIVGLGFMLLPTAKVISSHMVASRRVALNVEAVVGSITRFLSAKIRVKR